MPQAPHAVAEKAPGPKRRSQGPGPGRQILPGAPSRDPRGLSYTPRLMRPRRRLPGVPRGLGPWGALGQGLSATACWWNWLRGLAREGSPQRSRGTLLSYYCWGPLAAPRGFTEPMPRPLRQRRLPGPLIASGQGPLTGATRALIPPAKGCSSPGARAVPASLVPGLRG